MYYRAALSQCCLFFSEEAGRARSDLRYWLVQYNIEPFFFLLNPHLPQVYQIRKKQVNDESGQKEKEKKNSKRKEGGILQVYPDENPPPKKNTMPSSIPRHERGLYNE